MVDPGRSRSSTVSVWWRAPSPPRALWDGRGGLRLRAGGLYKEGGWKPQWAGVGTVKLVCGSESHFWE